MKVVAILVAVFSVAFCQMIDDQTKPDFGQDQLIAYLVQRGDAFDDSKSLSDEEISALVSQTFLNFNALANNRIETDLSAKATVTLKVNDEANNRTSDQDLDVKQDGKVVFHSRRERREEHAAIGLNVTTKVDVQLGNGSVEVTKNVEGGMLLRLKREGYWFKRVRADLEGKVTTTLTTDGYSSSQTREVKASATIRKTSRGNDRRDRNRGRHGRRDRDNKKDLDRHHHHHHHHRRHSAVIDARGEQTLRSVVTVGNRTACAEAKTYGNSVTYVSIR